MKAVYIVDNAKIAKVLVDPMRRAILDLLRQKPMTQAGLAKELGLSGASLNFHMKILRSNRASNYRQEGNRKTQNNADIFLYCGIPLCL